MSNAIPCYIGVSRSTPFRASDLIYPPSGVQVPRPFDIRHTWKQPTGRSTGGAYDLSNYESMTWMYAIGSGELYNTFIGIYNPVMPWVWVYFFDVYANAGAWWEAAMTEPKLDRNAGTTISNLTIVFNHMTKYAP